MRKAIAVLCAAIVIGRCVQLTGQNPDSRPGVRHDAFDCVVATDTLSREISLIFSADSMFEGGPHALDVLKARGIKASFFFTGNFLRDTANAAIVARVLDEGHYVGPHSDRHILLADWGKGRPTLVSADSMLTDLGRNLTELEKHGVSRESVTVALPPFEWCNAMHAAAYRSAGMTPVNPTPEVATYADYTTPDMPEYRTSHELIEQLLELERQRGLNGAIIIIHLGTQDARTDKLYRHLGMICDTLNARGYSFGPLAAPQRTARTQ